MSDSAVSGVSVGDDWLSAMDAVAEDDGYLEKLGPRHWAFFAEDGPALLVTFERAEAIRGREDRLPAAYAMAKARGWSILTLIAEGETFWRDRAVWGYVDRLVDDAFLDDFDRVLFYGAGPAGYAAAAYVVAAPGAHALLVSPRATLDPALAAFDRRHRKARALDWSSRYGFAPDMTEGARRVWLVHDPMNGPDAAHAALFRRPWVSVLNARHTGEGTERALAGAGILDRLIEQAMAGTLTAAEHARLWRARRGHAGYLKAILAEAAASGRPEREKMICRSVTRRLKAPRFARRLAELTGATSG